MKDLGLYYILLIQVGNPSGSTYDIVTTDSSSFYTIAEAIKDRDEEALEEGIDNANRIEILGDFMPREEAIQIAQEYADNNIVTIHMIIPQT